jgi:putative FmdB family regulatory protein
MPPIYEYLCDSWNHRFEKIVKMDEPNPACPSCGSASKKLVSGHSRQSDNWETKPTPSANAKATAKKMIGGR